MRYRRFGKTELDISIFSLGTMRALDSSETMTATLQRAWQLGINHFETAPSYGTSERLLGQAFRELGLPRSKFFFTSKLLPKGAAAEIERTITASLENLGTDYLDCLAIHGINTPEHLQWFLETGLGPLQQLQRQGKFRHLGFSTHGPLALILKAIETGYFEFVNLHYYYFFQRNAEAIALAAAKDLGIFIISPGDKGGQLFTPPQTLQTLCQPDTPLELTYRFLLGDRRITTLSFGAANPSELAVLVPLVDQDQPLTSQEQQRLTSLSQYQHQRLQGTECHQCYACLPCPEAIAIPEILRLRNLAIAYDMQSYGEYRYQMLENAGHWFPGKKGNACTECGDCLPRCPSQLPIPQLLQEAHQRLNGKPRRRLWET
ncbi:oxidoreductase [Picosynechococcus sp. PCC 7003]|uniref:aldo/keto reductase n=1 Tax=Picosynechococcus sp. PCC 7003 TaxID=374981 RepID=UPI000810A5EA|nr:aldo/keto reductase [Picosynechococcus sp. PCC 7003]ANV83294.1 oxidoreductase [Picosynechococcus sp. PCC 7003]